MGHFTRIVNQFSYRDRDTAKMAWIEYIDRPGELRPANPVGAARAQYVASEFLATRRGRRKHMAEMKRLLLRSDSTPLDAEVLKRCRFEVDKASLNQALPIATAG